MWLLFYFFNYFIVQLQLSAFQFPLKRKLLLLPVSCVPGIRQSPRKAQQGESTDGPEHCRQVTQVAWGWSQKCRHLVSISDLRDQAPVPDPTGVERAERGQPHAGPALCYLSGCRAQAEEEPQGRAWGPVQHCISAAVPTQSPRQNPRQKARGRQEECLLLSHKRGLSPHKYAPFLGGKVLGTGGGVRGDCAAVTELRPKRSWLEADQLWGRT